MSEGRLTGKVAVVTGGGRGIGATVADVLAADGADLAVAGRDRQALETVARALDEPYSGRSRWPLRCDVTGSHPVRYASAP